MYNHRQEILATIKDLQQHGYLVPENDQKHLKFQNDLLIDEKQKMRNLLVQRYQKVSILTWITIDVQIRVDQQRQDIDPSYRYKRTEVKVQRILKIFDKKNIFSQYFDWPIVVNVELR